MKILVVDDKSVHLDAAKAQLGGHDLVLADTYDQGQKLLQDTHGFDVVLVDLLMPASRQQQGPDGAKFVGQEMPVGIFLALLAAKNGAKLVAVHSDSCHHSHPASACFDSFSRFFWGEPDSNHSGWSHDEDKPHALAVGGAKLILSNNRNWVHDVNPENMAQRLSWEEKGAGKPSVRAKDWKAVLDYLLTL